MSRFVKGNYIIRACEATGISRQTFYNWLRLAEEGKQPYLDMFDTFKKAEAQASVQRIAVFRKPLRVVL